MARYYFDIRHENGCERDDTGLELPNADAIRATVSKVILDLAKDEIADDPHASFEVVVRDDSDFALFTAKLEYSTAWH